MKLLISLGMNGEQILMDWNKQVSEFPHMILHGGDVWNWQMFDAVGNEAHDYILYFSKGSFMDPGFDSNTPALRDLMSGKTTECECGARFTEFPEHHMFMCKLWRKK